MAHLCAICGSDSWHDLDSLRDRNYWFDKNYLFDELIGFKVCKTCGFVTYTPRWTEKQLKEKYTQDPDRQRVDGNKIIQAKKKTEFHKMFLADDPGKYQKVLDIGCSFGYVRDVFPNSEVYGSEYAKTLANYAERVNGIKMVGEISDLLDPVLTANVNHENTFDLIMLYHTFEHVSDPAGLLKTIKALLKSDGRLYITVPTYLDELREVSGKQCLNFEELFHLNHQNVFSAQSLVNVLHVNGFKIIKTNNQVYGTAVLCEITNYVHPYASEDYQKIEQTITEQKKAIETLAKGVAENKIEVAAEVAIGIYPKYLDAWQYLSSLKKSISTPTLIMQTFKKAMEVFPNNVRLLLHFAGIFANWTEPGRDNHGFRKLSLEQFEAALKLDPANAEAIFNKASMKLRYNGDINYARKSFDYLLTLNPMLWDRVQNEYGEYFCKEK